MKKMILKTALLAIASVGLLARSAMATPVYNGDTFAGWGEGVLPTRPTFTGYYI